MFLVDTDPGIDDAHALAVIAKYAADDELVVTTVAGNVGLDRVTDNAAWLLSTLAPGAALYRGSALPLVGSHEHAEHIHGYDGLGGLPRSEERALVQSGHAAEAIVKAYRTHGGSLKLIALGPLTNIALALAIEPGLVDCDLVCMGGSPAGYGNASINAEYNIYADPVAAESVFSRMPRVTLVTWDLTLTTRFGPEQIDQMFASGSQAAVLIGRLEQHRRDQDPTYADRSSFGRADGLAMAIAMDPTCVRKEVHHAVEVGIGGLAHGLTSVDWQDATERPKIRIIQEADAEAVLRVLTL